MPFSDRVLDVIRACSKDEAAFHQLVDLFERHASTGENLYRVLADHFPDGVVALLDHDLRFILMNGQGLQNTGLDSRSVQGKRLADVFSDEIAARDEPHIRAALKGEARATEVSYAGRYYLVHTLPVRDQDHTIIAAMVVTRDITERRQAEEAERAARLEAEQANEMKLRFLAMVSHELRTPLASIKGFASSLLAQDVTFDPETQQSFLAIIDQEADRLASLVDQLLDLSRLEAGTLSIMARPRPLADIVDANAGTLKMLASEHVLTMDVPESLPLVRADDERLAQVFTNLVGNAAKYAPPGTPIRVEAVERGSWVQVDVTDQGPGIDPADQLVVFEPFLQLSGKDSVIAKGAGLGLAICKGLIEAHGGHIWIADHEGPGTRVSFTLPIVSKANAN